MVTAFGSIDVVKAPPTLSAANCDELANSLRSNISRHRVHIVLDMSSTALMDSQGLEMLLDHNEACLRRGGEIVLANPTPLCAEILDLTGVDRKLNCHQDLRSALGSFAK